MNTTLADLIRISNTTGNDPSLVQGGGGNTSVKTPDGQHMVIKASGTSLKNMDATRGWRRLKIEPVLAILNDKKLAALDPNIRETQVVNRLLDSCDDGLADAGRPSVESHLHAMLDRCVIHLHPTLVGAYVNAVNGRKHIDHLFRNEKQPPLWVPYADPGFLLAKKLSQLVSQYKKEHNDLPRIIFLEKHGLIVTAPTPDGALRLVRRAISLCKKGIKPLKAAKSLSADPNTVRSAKIAIRNAYFAETQQYKPVHYVKDKTIAAFLARKDARQLASAGPLAPDDMIYSNGPAVWIETPDPKTIAAQIKANIKKGYDGPPTAYLVKNLGLFIIADHTSKSYVQEIMTGSLTVRQYAAQMGGVATLNARQQHFILQWESESFRAKMSRMALQGQLHNRIAVVTGAGSGLGRSIAHGLARAGAMVGLADIDTAAAQQTAEIIRNGMPQAMTTCLRCNVTDESSVRSAFDQLILEWGGLDILVNAAGVAPAYPLVDLPVDQWRFALEVNLTGYFLMAQAAARIMIEQNIGGNIINISSKSGLDASKNNTPYNATKAGELHMARGWAMELGQYGIRVNCVCPGNVFEGSKIWNPQYIKTCAKKYGIKPEDVIPYYVNKTILRREIKGQDIADAVVFLAGDQARTITGQTLVADAGQVMVR